MSNDNDKQMAKFLKGLSKKISAISLIFDGVEITKQLVTDFIKYIAEPVRAIAPAIQKMHDTIKNGALFKRNSDMKDRKLRLQISVDQFLEKKPKKQDILKRVEDVYEESGYLSLKKSRTENRIDKEQIDLQLEELNAQKHRLYKVLQDELIANGESPYRAAKLTRKFRSHEEELNSIDPNDLERADLIQDTSYGGESLEQKLDKLIELQLAQAQKAAEEKPKEGAPASVKESPHQIAYREGLKLDADLEQGATLLKAFFDELAPVTEQFGKLKEILSSLLAPEDMAALEAKTQEVAAKEGDAKAQDFNGLIEMLKQLLEKVNVILDPETGLLSPKEGSAPIVAPATGSVSSTGEGPSTVQEAQKKGEGIEAQLEAWDEIVRKFGENAVGAFENMLESGEISIKGLTKMLVQMAKKALIMQVIPRLFGFNSFGTEAGGMFNGLFGKETGGRVSVGMPYLVGEKRPEIFIPDSPGVIAARIGGTGAKVAGAGNQANVTQNINFTTDVANSVRAEVYNATPHIVAAAHQAVFDTLKGNRRY